MQTFATSVHSVSNSATQKAELHICLHSRARRGCAGRVWLQAAMKAVGQVQTTWPGSQAPPSVIGMKQESTQPESSTAEGVLANLWMSQDCVGREARKKKKANHQTQTKLAQKQSKRLWPQLNYLVGSTLHVPSSQEAEKRWGYTSQFSANISPAQKTTALKTSGKKKQKITLLFSASTRLTGKHLYTVI